eukprot:gene9648-17409_t
MRLIYFLHSKSFNSISSQLPIHDTPENCQTLFSPKINPEIWGKLNPNSKRNDIKLSVLQDGLLKATSAVSVAVSDLLFAREQKTTPDYKALIGELIDSIVLIGHVNRELTFKRRDSLRPHLSAEFKQVCSRNIKPGNFIFGDDLPETLKQMRATNRIVRSATPLLSSGFSAPRSYGPRTAASQYHHGIAPTTPRNSFLGYRGRLPYNPRQNNRQQQFTKKKFMKN